MSYTFFPPRTANYFPPGMPYLAGLRGTRGLGDYASDLNAYNTDIAKWRLEKLAYDRALKVNAAKIKTIDDTYAAASSGYASDKAQWDAEYAAYLLAAKAWNANFEATKAANTDKSMKIASAYGLNLTQAYYSAGACLSQADHDLYARQCSTVKGLGYLRGLGSADANCGLKSLPVCNFGPYPTIRAKPVAPTKASYPAAVAPLRPQPVAPTKPADTTPGWGGGGGGGGKLVPVSRTPSPSNDPGPATSDPNKNAGMIANGLILVALGVGGYLVYRTLKKPKAAA